MACNCSNCNTDPCGCKDHGLTTPCTYTNCATGNERCDDVQCTECVSYCGTSFQVKNSSEDVLKVVTGERLDQIIQKFALMIANGFGAGNADNVHHAPYNLYAEAITDTSITVVWNGISTGLTGDLELDIYVDSGGGYGVSPVNTSTINPSAQTKFVITNLTPNTEHKIKLQSKLNAADPQDSVELIVSTLAS
jgi:hypothetical protein